MFTRSPPVVHVGPITPVQILRNFGQLAILAGLFVCLLWPAIYNGGPLLDSDTSAYIRYADVAVSKLTNQPSEWWKPPVSDEGAPATDQGASASDQSSSPLHPKSVNDLKTPFIGRSIYYGMVLKFGDVLDKMWPSLVLQTAALLLAVALTLVHTTGLSLLPFSTLIVGLALATPTAFFASNLMPDLFTGITILAVANLIVFGGRMSRICLLTWVGLLSAGVLFHSTHVLIALATFAVCLVGRLFSRSLASWTGLAAVLFCVLVGFAGDALFSIVTERALGVTPIRPPFLTARTIADGPGKAYLKASCPGSGFAVCRFVDRLPVIDGVDTFLWSRDPAKGGVFTPADAATRRALSKEQFSFALAVFRYDPLGEMAAMARNTLDQFRRVSLAGFNFNNQDRDQFRQELPERYLKVAEGTRAWDDTLPVAPMAVVVLIVLLGSTAYVVRGLMLRSPLSVDGNDPEKLAVVIIIGILVNTFVCGTMSVPDQRYQTRVMWLIPLAAALIYWCNSQVFRSARQEMGRSAAATK
jgi:hypothetical protein